MKIKDHNNAIRFCLLWLLPLCLTQACVVKQLEYTPFQETDYYKQQQQDLRQHTPVGSRGDTLKVGWAKVNITPAEPAPLAGYGKRLGLTYTEVHDSVWVRTFAFDNGRSKAYFVTLDMLIVPMTVTAALEKEYAKAGLKPEQVYLSATHTHTSFGGWGKKLVGKLMAGKYEKNLVTYTTRKIMQSIALAQANTVPSQVGYGSANGGAYVTNKFEGQQAVRDSTIRFLKIEKVIGETAILCTFSGHPTILPSMQPVLSRDYPGALVDALEQQVTFAAFAAGAVATHRTVTNQGDTFASTAELGQQLATLILDAMPATPVSPQTEVAVSRVPLSLPKPHWRIGDKKRFAPLFFNVLFGKSKSFVSSLQVGSTVMLGIPADFAGELMQPLQQQANLQGQQLVLTGFNGGYIGYITPDRHYHLKKYETRDMNFFGPTGGSYLTEIIRQVLQQHGRLR